MRRHRVVAAAGAFGLSVVGCMDQGPMDQLREAMSTLAVPEALEPWRVQPWKGVDGWESLEMRDGREALIWEGPRGIDNETA